MDTYVYILTDCNRKCLHVGMTDDLNQATATYKELRELFFETETSASRLVYHEALPSEEAALRRFTELSNYTRMQKEKLIRRCNPNWVDLMSAKSLKPIRQSRRGTVAPSRHHPMM